LPSIRRLVRGSSRLLAALPDTAMADKMFADLPDWVQPGDVLVFNNTQGDEGAPVRPKRERRQD
jgi:S-adenosylmethionine:tRNA-ribosyltransferase-isomerase (queuine synthetase)